ncbi:hypothetical protein, partial [Kitasatospora sp. NPDC059817]|uniref:hypothetical protein n=1 Tax=Kitasatospora sp. NPDC059817 TaxID=3346961 RepID=UPI0036545C5F
MITRIRLRAARHPATPPPPGGGPERPRAPGGPPPPHPPPPALRRWLLPRAGQVSQLQRILLS